MLKYTVWPRLISPTLYTRNYGHYNSYIIGVNARILFESAYIGVFLQLWRIVYGINDQWQYRKSQG